MALQQVPGSYVLWPSGGFLNTSVTSNSYLLDASGDKTATTFQCPRTGTISGCTIMMGTVTTGGTLTVNLKDVSSTTGQPGATTHASGTVVINDTDDNIAVDVTFSGTYSATMGEWLALEVVCGSPGNMNIIAFTWSATFVTASNTGAFWHDSGAGYAVQATRLQNGTLNFNGSYYYVPRLWHLNGTSLTILETTTNDRQEGMKFQVPFACQCYGVRWINPRTNDLKVNLWDSDGATVLRTVSLDKDTAQLTQSPIEVYWSSEVTLSINTWYRVSVTPTAAALAGVYRWAVGSGKLGTQPGGDKCYQTESNVHPPTQESHWTDTTTQVTGFQLLLSQLDDGVSTGGMGVSQGLQSISSGITA